MRSKTLPKFWDNYYALPTHVQRRAKRAYKAWKQNPISKGLGFKLLVSKNPSILYE